MGRLRRPASVGGVMDVRGGGAQVGEVLAVSSVCFAVRSAVQQQTFVRPNGLVTARLRPITHQRYSPSVPQPPFDYVSAPCRLNKGGTYGLAALNHQRQLHRWG